MLEGYLGVTTLLGHCAEIARAGFTFLPLMNAESGCSVSLAAGMGEIQIKNTAVAIP